MGHLFSRAFKRITQLSSSRNSSTSQQPEQLSTGEQDISQQQGRPSLHETIPVGQSIDSSEYRALDSNEQHQIDTSNQENTAPILTNTTTTTTTTTVINNANNNNNNNNEGNNKQDVEEAVIKIQALVRGHLTRKALKDAHHHSLPAQNALGQCQFDEESLTRNPPSAVFLPSSPLNYLSNDGDFTNTTQNNSRTITTTTTTTTSSSCDKQQQQHQPSRTPLESIAEVTETVTSATQDTGSDSSDNKQVSRHDLATSAAASKLDMPVTEAASGVGLRSSDGKSPPTLLLSRLSEATTSIDINCDETPTSASILISDHNIKPSDRIASVLHYKEDKQQQQQERQQQQQQSGTTTNAGELPRVGVSEDEQRSHNNCDLNNGIVSQQQQQQGMLATDSLDSEEAAAIRIQSAFRGYRTRKNSPYRTRSPSSSIDANIKRNGICPQDANILNEATHHDHDMTAVVSNEEQIEAARLVGRRESRQRHRDLSPTQQIIAAASVAVAAADDHQRTSGGFRDESRLEDKRQQQRGAEHIQAATSFEEFTTTDDTINTVKEATSEMPNQQQRQTLSETGLETTQTLPQTITADQSAVLESVKQQLDEPNNDNNNNNSASESSRKADGLSFSFDIAGGLSDEANTLDETGLSAALEAVQETTNTDDLIENGAGGGILRDNSLNLAPRPSEASVELDTDSSVLGAALSLNEDIISAANNVGVSVQQQQLQDRPINDDKSQGASLITDELEFEARRLVDELNREAAVEDAADSTNQDERDDNSGAIVEDRDVIDDQDEIILNEEEQRVIEMESDDIERRDPRGHASEERAKSPQIRSSEEEPKFNVTTTTTAEQLEPPEIVGGSEKVGETTEREKSKTEVEAEKEEEEIIGSTGAHLEVQSPDEGRTSSGRSSPAINSSAANSSSESDDNSEVGTSPTTTTTPTKQQTQAQGNSQTRQQQNNQQTGKNKRKNRKRKSKK